MGQLGRAHKAATHYHTAIENAQAEATETFGKKLRWVLLSMLRAALGLTIGVLLFLISLGLQVYVLVAILMGGGLWVGMRYIAIALCTPLLLDVAPLTDDLNVVIRGLNLVMPSITVVMNAVINMFDVVSGDVEKLLGLHPLDVPDLPEYTQRGLVSRAQVTYALTTIPVTCRNYATAGEVFVYFSRLALHTVTCPAVRWLKPLPWAFNGADTMLGWTYFGSAAPDPNDPNANCDAVDGNFVYDTVCASMGFGFVILVIVLPLFLFFSLWVYTYSSVGTLVADGIYIAYEFVAKGLGYFVLALDTAFV
jgi:hypothetical protein